MLKEAINRILELAKVETLTFDERKYTTGKIYSVPDPTPAPLHLETLTGLRDYVLANKDGLLPENLMLHVESHDKVRLISALDTTWLNRDAFALAETEPSVFPFGRWLDLRSFIIELQSKMVQDDNTAVLLKIVGNLRKEAGISLADDGVTQKVEAKTGIVRVENVNLPNPITLRPYRTFIEIEQPASTFVFRMEDGGGKEIAAALFASDGGQWRNEAWWRDNCHRYEGRKNFRGHCGPRGDKRHGHDDDDHGHCPPGQARKGRC